MLLFVPYKTKVLKSIENSAMNTRKENQPSIEIELYLRHLTIEEARLKLDKYLDDAFMSGFIQVRIVHGKGTGVLRNFVRKELKEHPLVKSYRPGEYGEGGAGVTIVELVYR
jgi:DNA mismatch repair protein MutS2